jgi:PST family polysaccharide transporter
VRLHKRRVADEPRKGLRGRVRSAAAWTALDVAVNRGSGFLIGVVVARLLEPHDFGIYAVALVVHAIVINVSELGVSTALVREEASAADETGPTIVTIAIVTSFALGALMAASASTFARLLGAPGATSTIQVMAITLPLAGLSAVPAALLRRDFRMDRLFVADTANGVASGAVVIVLALAGWGPLALAWAFVAGQLLTTVILLLQPVARYRPGWSRKQAGRLLRFGLPLAGANVLAFAIQNVDYVIVGRLMGSVDLGLYVLAFNVSGWPQNVFSSVVRSVSVPAFSRLRERGSDMPRDFGTALRTVARVTLPVCLILGALAHPLIRTVYGAKWDLAYAPLIGLSVMAAARAMIELFSDFLVSLGRTRAVMLFPLVWLPALTVALLLLVHADGIAGAGIAQAGVSWLVVVPLVAYLVSRCAVRPRIVMGALLPPLGWAILTAAAAWLVSTQVKSPLLACAAGGCTGLALYVLPHLPALRQALTKRRNRRASLTAPAIEVGDLAAEAVPQPDLSVIIVTHGRPQLAIETVRHAEAAMGGLTAQWLVVDSGSTDGTPDAIERACPGVTVDRLENVGFAAANNHALASARGRYVLLLNPDCVVAEGSFASLLKELDARPEVGVASVIQRAPDGALQYSIRRYPSPWLDLGEAIGAARLMGVGAWRQEETRPQCYELPWTAEWLVGAFLLARAEAVAEVGPLDERFFLYSEETDWCYRFRLAGWQLLHLPTMTVTHHTGTTRRAELTGQLSHAKLLFAQKHFRGWRSEAIRAALVLRHSLRASAAATLGLASPAWARRAASERYALSVVLGRTAPPFADR